MPKTFFTAETLDDVMQAVIAEVISHGEPIESSKGANRELTAVLLEVTNPRARLSRTETRGKPFSTLGELCWYLGKSDDLGFIAYYISQYAQFAEGETLWGAYGPRLFGGDHDQVANVIALLKKKPSSRQAVIQLFNADDIAQEHKDVPCTCVLQMMIRGQEPSLHMITYMRSNDVVLGLPHDFFCFTMLQEIVATSLSLPIGTYKHVVGSIHMYDDKRQQAEQFIGEGWQSTNLAMPPMPTGDPRPAIDAMLKAESDIRNGTALDANLSKGLDPYWADLIRLLAVFRYSKDNDIKAIRSVRRMMASSIYDLYIDQRISDCQARIGQDGPT